MGFVNSSPPPGPPVGGLAPGDPAPERPSPCEMAALSSAADAARAATSRYRRRPEGIRAYAWAISLGLHAVVLAGAYIAYRYYFPFISREATSPAAAQPAEGAGPDSIVLSDDATDAVHGGILGGLTLTADAGVNSAEAAQVPSTIDREPKTIGTLQELAPRSGIDSFTASPAAFPRRQTAKRPNGF